MFNVSNSYKSAALQPVQEHRLTGTIGSVSFDENNIVSGTFNIRKQCTDTSDVVLGSCFIGQLSATFTGVNINRGAWYNKVVTPFFGIKLSNNTWESVPLGVFKIKNVHVSAEGVEVIAYDNMAKFDKVVKHKKTTLNIKSDSMWTFIDLACRKCNVTLGMTKAQIDSLPNGSRQQADIEIYGDAKSTDFANDIETYRDLLYWCAQTMGCFATIDRAGQLIFKQYTQSIDETITDNNRLAGAVFDDYTTHYTGLYFTDMDTNDDTYYGYDVQELQAQIAETQGDLTETEQAIVENAADIVSNAEDLAELETKHNQGQITDEEYAQQKAVLDNEKAELLAEKNRLEKLAQKLFKRLSWLQDELAQAQADDEGATMDCGANPFLQYTNLTKRDNTRKRVLAALDEISYTPFTCSLLCGAHFDLGDIIYFSGGHANNDICCVMAWSYTHNAGTEIQGFGVDPSQYMIKSKARKEAKKANSTATTTGHTYVAESNTDPSQGGTESGAPRGSKNGDVWVQTKGAESLISDLTLTPNTGGMFTNVNKSLNDDGTNSITASLLSDIGEFLACSFSGLTVGKTYYLSFDFQKSGNNDLYIDQIYADRDDLANCVCVADSWDKCWYSVPKMATGGLVTLLNNAYANGKAITIYANNDLNHYEMEFEALATTMYLVLAMTLFINGYQGSSAKNIWWSNIKISNHPSDYDYTETLKYNENGTFKNLTYVKDVDTSENAGTDSNNGLIISNETRKLSLKPNVMRALYKVDPPQKAVNFSRFCVRCTGEPDKSINIESYTNHTWENKSVKYDDEKAYKIKCGGVGGSGKYCVYKITGLTSGSKYYFNFAVNWSNGATFGNDTTKGLGLVFNTTGTISTDAWSGEPDTFNESTLYYSMRRSTTKNYADFSFTAIASTMYMCVVTADITSNAEINLVLSEFVISNLERKLIRGIYLYDYEKNVWLKYRPFGSITGGGDEGGGSVVRIEPTLLSGAKVADYSIDGENGSLYAPDNSYSLPIASADTLGGIKVGQNLSIDQNGTLSATGGGGGASSLDDLSDVDIASPSDGQVLKYIDGEWVNGEDTGGADAVELTQQQYDALSAQQKADPTKVYYVTDAPSSDLDIDDLQNVNISNPSSGQILKYNGSKWINSSSGAGISNCYYGQVLSNAITLSSPVNAGEVGSFDFVIPRSDLYGNGFIVSVMPSGGWAKDANGNDIGFIYMTNSYFQEDSTTPKPYDSCDLYVHCVFINTTNDAVKSFSYITSNYVLLS